MQLFNLLTKRVSEKDPVSLKVYSKDFILSIPHSGTFFPNAIKHKYNLTKNILIGTDIHTNTVYNIKKGIQVIANLSPGVVNMNRFRTKQTNPNLPDHLKRNPLEGQDLFGNPSLKTPLTIKEKNYLLKIYDYYHAKIKEFLNFLKKTYGFAFMLDCHAMNSTGLSNTPDQSKERPDFNIGTLNNKDPKVSDLFYNILSENAAKHNLLTCKDFPYSGGFITMNYSDPKNKIHCLQLEIKKSLYMDEELTSQKKDFKLKRSFIRINSILSKTVNSFLKEL